jgi:hypothetical protein
MTIITEKIFGRIFDSLGEEIAHIANNRILEYKTNLYQSLSFTKTIFHRTEVDFVDIYEPVCLLDIDNNSIEYKDIFLKGKNVTILGEAGLGKSSFIRNLVLDQIKKEDIYPILIELRDLDHVNVDLLSYIKTEILRFEKIAESERIQQRLFETGKLCIVFEGYDELSKENKNEVLGQIKRITKRYPNNKYIITSRPFTGIEYFEGFRNYNLSELKPAQIVNFINRQFSKIEPSNLPVKIIASIKDEKNELYLNYLRNPLLLSLFLLTFDEHAGLPQKQSEFFSDIFETLFHTHNSLSKMGFQRKLDTDFDKQSIEIILQCFSFLSFFEETYVFPREYFTSKLDIIKEKKDLKFNTQDLENDLVIGIGILSKEGSKILFPHRTLQEYFAISYIARLSKESKIKAYTKMRSFFFNKKEVGDLSGFYTMLMEIDFCNAAEYFLIPLLNELKEFNQQKLGTSQEDDENRFFRSLDMLRLFKFDDFLLDELFERGTSLHKKMSLAKKYDAEVTDVMSQIKTTKRKLKAVREELKFIDSIIPTLEYNKDYIRRRKHTEIEEETLLYQITNLDSSKSTKRDNRRMLMDEMRDAITLFNKEVATYLDLKIPELITTIQNKKKSDAEIVELI